MLYNNNIDILHPHCYISPIVHFYLVGQVGQGVRVKAAGHDKQ